MSSLPALSKKFARQPQWLPAGSAPPVGCRRAHFLDQSLRLGVGFRQIFISWASASCFDILGCLKVLSSPAPPTLKHRDDRLTRVTLQNPVDNGKQHHLSYQVRPVNAKLFSHIASCVHKSIEWEGSLLSGIAGNLQGLSCLTRLHSFVRSL